jgi:hypothetical protein
MPTGSTIFKRIGFDIGCPKKLKVFIKLSTKKLKYLKKPRKPRFIDKLVNNRNFLLALSFVFDSPIPTK